MRAVGWEKALEKVILYADIMQDVNGNTGFPMELSVEPRTLSRAARFYIFPGDWENLFPVCYENRDFNCRGWLQKMQVSCKILFLPLLQNKSLSGCNTSLIQIYSQSSPLQCWLESGSSIAWVFNRDIWHFGIQLHEFHSLITDLCVDNLHH